MTVEVLQQEVFFLAYHLHWACSEIMELPTDERCAYVTLLARQIERENAQIKAARTR